LCQLADGSGDVTLVQGYTPFGVPLWHAGSSATGYSFTGEQWEAYAQLLFLRARYYEPGTGRFVSKDPWPGDVQRPQTLNPFVYVENRVVVRVDPSGRQSSFEDSSSCYCPFIVSECGPGLWHRVCPRRYRATVYFTPVEWDFPSPTDTEYVEFTNVEIPWTGQIIDKLVVHPEFWDEVDENGGGRLDARDGPEGVELGRGWAVLRYHGGLERHPRGAPGHGRVQALQSVAMNLTFIANNKIPLKLGDEICIPELRTRTPYHGIFRYHDTGGKEREKVEPWLDIYIGEGEEALERYGALGTGDRFEYTIYRRMMAGACDIR
jgi:RHS repeat-associated protein